MKQSYDVCVIGAGPAGLTAAMYLARSGCSVALVEALASGGQVLQTAMLDNYPGFPNGIKGYELADFLSAHLESLDVDRISDTVVSVAKGEFDFAISLGASSFEASAVIACPGAKHRLLGIEREGELTGHGVSYCALCDGNFFRNCEVAVVGGGNAALEESLYLANIAARVHLIHRREAFRGLQAYQDKVARSDRIVLHRNSKVTRLVGDAQLTGVVIADVNSGKEEELSVEGLFIYVGFEPVTSFLPPELKRDEQGFIITDVEMRTNMSGLFAAGDIRSKLCRQAITAAGDGATAAHAAFLFLEHGHV